MADAEGLELKPTEACELDLVSLGEVMLRFDPGEGRIATARSFRVWEGGGEYNVARGLRRCFGIRTGIVSALVDNPVGRLIEDLMLQGGVDQRHVHWVPFDGVGRQARNGVYFLERGFGVRGALGMMDRGATAISQMGPDDVDWDRVFAGLGSSGGVRWFHTGGVMAGLSTRSTEVVQRAMVCARHHGVTVSFDCNYRPSLWQDRGGRAGSIAANRSLMPLVDVLFGHEGDIAATIGDASLGPPWHTGVTYGPMADRIAEEFPQLKVIASTVRQAVTASQNAWGAYAWAAAGKRVIEGIHFDNLELLDRVGGGDSFAAGLIYGLMAGKGLQWAVDCGVAHGALAMTTPGDSSMSSLADVERLMRGGSAAVQR